MRDKNVRKQRARLKRSRRVRGKVRGTAERPRLVVFKSLNHIYAQLVDDTSRKTITGISSLKTDSGEKQKQTDKAKAVGTGIAKKAQDLGIKTIVFDRSGYRYHGNIKALAEAAREAGLEF
jgi:large subunit ribosomal protein L18